MSAEPPSGDSHGPADREARLEALRDLEQLQKEILARRGGRPIEVDDLLEALRYGAEPRQA